MKMIPLSNDLTTYEQSKKLIALGVPVESANFYATIFTPEDDSGYSYLYHVFPVDDQYNFRWDNVYKGIIAPIWSSGRIMEIMLICSTAKTTRITIEGKKFGNELIDQLIKDMESMLKDNKIFGKALDFSKLEDRP